MPVNSNIGRNWPDTNAKTGPIGADNPGPQQCPNCRQHVTPVAGLGIRIENNGGNSGLGNFGHGTGIGYTCPACGHSFSWVKSTGRPGGPVLVDNTNQVTTADA